MDYKALKKEVLALRDEVAKMKRLYDDILYNLDDDNFSARIVKEKKNMKSQIEVTASEIKTKVSEADVDGKLLNYSTISQTATGISLAVADAEEEMRSEFTITAEAISTRVGSIEDFSTFVQDSNGFVLNGEKLQFNGVIYLTDSNGIPKFDIFYTNSQAHDEVILWSPIATAPYGVNIVVGAGLDTVDFSRCYDIHWGKHTVPAVFR